MHCSIDYDVISKGLMDEMGHIILLIILYHWSLSYTRKEQKVTNICTGNDEMFMCLTQDNFGIYFQHCLINN